jgi:hypothetical protein
MSSKQSKQEIKKQVKYLSKNFNVQKIRIQLKKIMPRHKVLTKSVSVEKLNFKFSLISII